MNIFFDSWDSIIRTFIITIIAYIVLVVMLRASGKRTLSKMNAFDFIITIALGSTFATVCLSKDVALADGVLALFLMIMMQYMVTWMSVRYKWVKQAVTNEPVMLLYRGQLLKHAVKKERITIEELHVAARKKGLETLDDIDAIIIETTGDLTIIPKLQNATADTLQDVQHHIK